MCVGVFVLFLFLRNATPPPTPIGSGIGGRKGQGCQWRAGI